MNIKQLNEELEKILNEADNDMQKWYKANRYLVKFDGTREDEVVYAHTKDLAREMAEKKYGVAVKEVIFIDNNLDRENKYQEITDKHIVDESVNTTKLKTEIENKIKQFFKNDEDALDWAIVDITEDHNEIKVEVRVELDYNGMWNLSELLNPIVSKYDKYAYFDFEQPGIMVATIERKNSTR